MNQLYLVRHGENFANITREFSHRKVDYSLTRKGRLQAAQTAQYFRELGIDEIYSSPLKRARETAAAIGAALHLPVTVIEEFREVNVGCLEEEPPTREAWDLHNQIIAAWLRGCHWIRFPGGENFIELRERTLRGYRIITQNKTERKIVVVAHGGIISFTLGEICPGIQLSNHDFAMNNNCSITEVHLDGRSGAFDGRLVRWASCDHLSGDAAKFVSVTPDDHH